MREKNSSIGFKMLEEYILSSLSSYTYPCIISDEMLLSPRPIHNICTCIMVKIIQSESLRGEGIKNTSLNSHAFNRDEFVRTFLIARFIYIYIYIYIYTFCLDFRLRNWKDTETVENVV